MDPQTQFCTNMACPARGKVGKDNIVVHSRKEARYQCKVCGKTFAATTGTPFYRLRNPVELVTLVVTLIAYGCPVQAIVAAFQLDERTIMIWQARSGKHCQQVPQQLVQPPRELGHVQADEVRVKAQGKILWMAMAIMVQTRLWLGGVVALIQIVRSCALARPMLICVDGLHSYVKAIQRVFRTPLPTGKRGRPQLISWPDIHIGQVVVIILMITVCRQTRGGCDPAHGTGIAIRRPGVDLQQPRWHQTQYRFHRAHQCYLPLPPGLTGSQK